MVFDSHLSWNEHIEGLQSKINEDASQTLLICASKAVQKLYSSLVLPALDYCDVVWDGCSKTAQANLEIVHNNAARAIRGAPYRSSATSLRNQLGWSTLAQRRENHTAVWMYRCVRGSAPSYLQNIFVPNSEIHQHYTRQSSGVYMPHPRTNKLKRSFEYRSTVLWNSLSESTRTAKSLNVFKQLILSLIKYSLVRSVSTVCLQCIVL